MLTLLTRRFAPRNSYFFRRENIELKRRKHGTLFSIQLFSFFLKGYFLPLKKVKFIYYLYIYIYNIIIKIHYKITNPFLSGFQTLYPCKGLKKNWITEYWIRMVLPMPPVLGCMGSFFKKENRSSVPNRCSMLTRAVSMLWCSALSFLQPWSSRTGLRLRFPRS